jgi:enoyl-CoA hydratase
MTVQTERRGRVLLIRMQREEKRNAVNADMATALDAALNTLDDDPGLWAGVLTGTTAVFSAGTDLKEGRGAPTPRGGEYGVVRRRRQKPLIAAVEGLALGGGFEIALACDLIVAARDARLGLPEVTRGVIANCGALFRAARALPLNIAREMLITGEPMSAERAHHFGLVNQLTEPGAALAQAMELAERISRNAPVSVRETLRALDRLVAAEDAAAWQISEEATAIVAASADKAEGVQAFLEKRPPRWQGQ